MHLVQCRTLSSYIPSKGLMFLQKFSFISTPCITNFPVCLRTTDGFPFKRGVFQDDPLSPIIFLMVFNPIIEFPQSKNDCGFNLNGDKIITLLVLVSKQCAIIYQALQCCHHTTFLENEKC